MSVSKKIQDDATLRLLKVLGELTPDLEINNATTAMNVAYVRIKRLEEELSDSREVYAVMYGCVDLEEEIVHQLYTTQEIALNHARQTAKEVLSDNPEDYANVLVKDVTDDNGNNVIIIATVSTEMEWWRVVPMKVWEK